MTQTLTCPRTNQDSARSISVASIRTVGAYFKQRLEELKTLPVVKEVRGHGLMLAVELNISGKEIVKQLLSQGYILNCTHETVLRLLPPFIISEKQIDKFVRSLRAVLESCSVPDAQAIAHARP